MFQEVAKLTFYSVQEVYARAVSVLNFPDLLEGEWLQHEKMD